MGIDPSIKGFISWAVNLVWAFKILQFIWLLKNIWINVIICKLVLHWNITL